MHVPGKQISTGYMGYPHVHVKLVKPNIETLKIAILHVCLSLHELLVEKLQNLSFLLGFWILSSISFKYSHFLYPASLSALSVNFFNSFH